MAKNKRLIVSLASGALLGVFCILGIGNRFGFSGNTLFLFSAWYNRVVMGLAIGLAGDLKINTLIRGGVFGLIISSAWFFSTNFADPLGFMAGIMYGVIIDYTSNKLA